MVSPSSHQKNTLKNNGKGWYSPQARQAYFVVKAWTATMFTSKKKPTWNAIKETYRQVW